MNGVKHFTLIDCKLFGHTEGSFPDWKFFWEVAVKVRINEQEEHHVSSDEELMQAMYKAFLKALYFLKCLDGVILAHYHIGQPDSEGMFSAYVRLSGNGDIWPARGKAKDSSTAGLQALVFALEAVISESLANNNAS